CRSPRGCSARRCGRPSGKSRRLRGAQAVVCVPDHATSLERHVLRQVCKDAGINQVRSVPHSVAAAVGAGVSGSPAGRCSWTSGSTARRRR
ncbi:rod shape-determining protein, partial [Streptomyces sp. SolWspMP-sol7th]|uniref:rod shape-determining protein n=1 Tax=Streptomyces sp. SolWspMP-sol7th TaxID=1839776 RepID=UPI0020C8296E